MEKIKIFAINKVVELKPFEYEIDNLSRHGGVRIILENLINEELKLELNEITKRDNLDMVVGCFVS